MGSNDEFGPDTETIRAWLAKRATYAKDARVVAAPRGTGADQPTLPPTPQAPVEAPAATVAEPAPRPTSPAAPTLPDAAHPPADAPPRLRRPASRSGPDSTSAGRDVLAALGGEAAPAAPPVAPSAPPPGRSSATPDSTTAGRSVVDALRGGTDDAAATPSGARHPSAGARPSTEDDRRDSGGTASRWTEPEEHANALQASTDADFPVRAGARRVLSIVMLTALAGSGVTAYLAAQDQTPMSIGAAATMAFLTLVIWAVRTGFTTTELSIRRGQLTIRRAGRAEVVDLASRYTPIAIVGEPGHRRWTVLIERPGLPLVVINASMVDPYWFTTSLYRLRPELRPGAATPPVPGQYADTSS